MDGAWDKVHHRNLQGLNDIILDKDTEPFRFPRGGALIGGPDKYNIFINSVTEYTTTESGCDYNAGITGALGALISLDAPYESVVSTRKTQLLVNKSTSANIYIKRNDRVILVTGKNSTHLTCHLFDTRARHINVQSVQNNDGVLIDMSTVGNGAYFLRIDVDGQLTHKKVLLK